MGTNGGAAPTRHPDATVAVDAPVERRIELLGEHDRSLDDRGRLSMPTAFRWAYADGAVLLPWPGPCVALLTLDEYRTMEEAMRVKQRDRLGDPRAREALNALSTHALLDASGRLFIAPTLRAHAGFTQELLIVGQRTRLELWARPTHETGADERWQALVAHIDAEAV
jgi:MraZ protein